MVALAPALAVIAGLLALAGAAKLRAPLPSRVALQGIGLPHSRTVVGAIGVSELSLGIWVALRPGPLNAALLAVAYLSFAAVVVAMIRTNARRAVGTERDVQGAGAAIPCGCFGAGSLVPGRGHVALNLLAASVAAAAVASPPPAPERWLAADPLAGAVALAAVGCSVWLALVVFTLVPDTWKAWAS